jgi:uncharacterized membrane protein
MSHPRHALTAAQREAVGEALRVLDDLDSAAPRDMTSMYYPNGFEYLHIVLRDLLRALEAAPAEAPTRASFAGAGAMRENLPRLTSTLARADALRRERIDRLRDGARFRGLDEVLTNLDELRSAFDDDVALRRLSFLIERCVADFETAIENALSGYLSVAMDAMRDVMEVENLLVDFAVDTEHIERWLAADARTLRTTYAPAEVRNRLHRAQVGAYASSAEAHRRSSRTIRSTRSIGWVPFALVALVLVPAIAGSLRLVELAGGPHLMPANPRISASRAPVVVHIVCALAYAIVGAFQFSAALRRRHPGWHRVAGRVVVVLGLAVAFSGLWMTQFYPRQLGTGELTYVFRLAFGSGMAASIILGFAAIRRGDVTSHQAWMTRAYALALGAGTQVFTQGIGEPIFGTGELTNALLLGAGWAINLAVAEYVIRWPRSRRPSRAPAEIGH